MYDRGGLLFPFWTNWGSRFGEFEYVLMRGLDVVVLVLQLLDAFEKFDFVDFLVFMKFGFGLHSLWLQCRN